MVNCGWIRKWKPPRFGAILDLCFSLTWLLSIALRPTAVSLMHAVLFGIYVLFGGIVVRKFRVRKRKVVLRYATHASLYLAIAGFCLSVALTQTIFQVMFAAGVMSGSNQSGWLRTFGFHKPRSKVDWVVYIGLDWFLALFSLVTWIFQRKVTVESNPLKEKKIAHPLSLYSLTFSDYYHTNSSLDDCSPLFQAHDQAADAFEDELNPHSNHQHNSHHPNPDELSVSANIATNSEISHSLKEKQSLLESTLSGDGFSSKRRGNRIMSTDSGLSALSRDDGSTRASADLSSEVGHSSSMPISPNQVTLPLMFRSVECVLLLIIAVASPSVLHLIYFIGITAACVLFSNEWWRKQQNWLHLFGGVYLWMHLMLIVFFQIHSVRNDHTTEDKSDNDNSSNDGSLLGSRRTRQILGLCNLHVKLVPYSDIKDTRVSPILIQTVAMALLFFWISWRPALIHQSIVRAKVKTGRRLSYGGTGRSHSISQTQRTVSVKSHNVDHQSDYQLMSADGTGQQPLHPPASASASDTNTTADIRFDKDEEGSTEIPTATRESSKSLASVSSMNEGSLYGSGSVPNSVHRESGLKGLISIPGFKTFISTVFESRMEVLTGYVEMMEAQMRSADAVLPYSDDEDDDNSDDLSTDEEFQSTNDESSTVIPGMKADDAAIGAFRSSSAVEFFGDGTRRTLSSAAYLTSNADITSDEGPLVSPDLLDFDEESEEEGGHPMSVNVSFPKRMNNKARSTVTDPVNTNDDAMVASTSEMAQLTRQKSTFLSNVNTNPSAVAAAAAKMSERAQFGFEIGREIRRHKRRVRKKMKKVTWDSRINESWEKLSMRFRWRLFLSGPLICQCVLLWTCFPRLDAFFFVILLWSLFVAPFVNDVWFERSAYAVAAYSLTVAMIKFVCFIPGLVFDVGMSNNDGDGSDPYARDWSLKDWSDRGGVQLFYACLPFITLCSWIHSRDFHCWSIADLRRMVENDDEEMAKRIASDSPMNFTLLRTEKGGNILHFCVLKGASKIIPLVAPFVSSVNERNMYGKLPLQLAKQIRKRLVKYKIRKDKQRARQARRVRKKRELAEKRRQQRLSSARKVSSDGHSSNDDESEGHGFLTNPLSSVDHHPTVAPVPSAEAQPISSFQEETEEDRMIQDYNDIILALIKVGCYRTKDLSFLGKIWSFLSLISEFFVWGFWNISEKLILICVYVLSTERPDLLHFFYLLLFVIFASANSSTVTAVSDNQDDLEPKKLKNQNQQRKKKNEHRKLTADSAGSSDDYDTLHTDGSSAAYYAQFISVASISKGFIEANFWILIVYNAMFIALRYLVIVFNIRMSFTLGESIGFKPSTNSQTSGVYYASGLMVLLQMQYYARRMNDRTSSVVSSSMLNGSDDHINNHTPFQNTNAAAALSVVDEHYEIPAIGSTGSNRLSEMDPTGAAVPMNSSDVLTTAVAVGSPPMAALTRSVSRQKTTVHRRTVVDNIEGVSGFGDGMNFSEYVLKNVSKRTDSVGFAIVYGVWFLPYDWFLLGTYLVLISIGLSRNDLLNLLYIAGVFLCMLVHQWFPRTQVWSALKLVWVFLTVYCLAAFLILYGCQYSFFYRWLKNRYPHWLNDLLTLHDLGLKHQENSEDFGILRAMLGPTIALVLSVIQCTQFFDGGGSSSSSSLMNDSINQSSKNGVRLEVGCNHPWNQVVFRCNGLLTLLRNGMPHFLCVVGFVLCVREVNLISLLYLFFIVLCLPIQSLFVHCWAPLSLVSMIAFFTRYVFQFSRLHKYHDNVNWHVLGFRAMKKPNDLVDIWHNLGQDLIMFLLATLQIVLMRWVSPRMPQKIGRSSDFFSRPPSGGILWSHQRRFYEDVILLQSNLNVRHGNSDPKRSTIGHDRALVSPSSPILLNRSPDHQPRSAFYGSTDPAMAMAKGNTVDASPSPIRSHGLSSPAQPLKNNDQNHDTNSDVRNFEEGSLADLTDEQVMFARVTLNWAVMIALFKRSSRRLGMFAMDILTRFGLIVCLVLVLFSAFYRNNILSVFGVIVIVGLYIGETFDGVAGHSSDQASDDFLNNTAANTSHSTSLRYRRVNNMDDSSNIPNNKREDSRHLGIGGGSIQTVHLLRRFWWMLVMLYGLWLLLEYWIVIPYELGDRWINDKWEKVFHFGKDFEDHKQKRWTYLGFANFKASDLFFDFFLYFTVAVQYQLFTSFDNGEYDLINNPEWNQNSNTDLPRVRAGARSAESSGSSSSSSDSSMSQHHRKEVAASLVDHSSPKKRSSQGSHRFHSIRSAATMSESTKMDDEETIPRTMNSSVAMKWHSERSKQADLLWAQFKSHALLYFDKLVLILMFVFAMVNIDILSSVFLIAPFVILFYIDSSDVAGLIRWWSRIQVYNWMVLCLFAVYQLWLIPQQKVNESLGFIPWHSVLGLSKLKVNGRYCPVSASHSSEDGNNDSHSHNDDCLAPFDDNPVLYNILLLILIDIQIQLLHSKEYHRMVVVLNRWKLDSWSRRIQSALFLRFRRLTLSQFFLREREMVKQQLNELFHDPQYEHELAFRDDELTMFPELEGNDRIKERKEEEQYMPHSSKVKRKKKKKKSGKKGGRSSMKIMSKSRKSGKLTAVEELLADDDGVHHLSEEEAETTADESSLDDDSGAMILSDAEQSDQPASTQHGLNEKVQYNGTLVESINDEIFASSSASMSVDKSNGDGLSTKHRRKRTSVKLARVNVLQFMSEMDIETEKHQRAEKSFTPMREGWPVLIDSNMDIMSDSIPEHIRDLIPEMNSDDGQKSGVSLLDLFEDATKLPWRRHLRNKYDTDAEPFVAQLICGRKLGSKPERKEEEEKGSEQHGTEETTTEVMKKEEKEEVKEEQSGGMLGDESMEWVTTTVGVSVVPAKKYLDLHPSIGELPADSLACVIIRAECSTLDRIKITLAEKITAFWIWLRWFCIASIDTALYCDAIVLQNGIRKLSERVLLSDSSGSEVITEDQMSSLADPSTAMKSSSPAIESSALLSSAIKEKSKSPSAAATEIPAQTSARQKRKSLIASLFDTGNVFRSMKRRSVNKEGYFNEKRHEARKELYESIEKDVSSVLDLDDALKMGINIHATTLDSLDTENVFSLMIKALVSHSEILVFFTYMVIFLSKGTMIDSIIPSSIVLYALMVYPRPSEGYWMWLISFELVSMSLRFLFQLTIFCVATDELDSERYYYDLAPNPMCVSIQDSAKSDGFLRFDLVLGIRKSSATYSGLNDDSSANYYSDDSNNGQSDGSSHSSGAVQMLFGDIVCLTVVAFHLLNLKRKGVLQYSETKTDDNYIDRWFDEFERRLKTLDTYEEFQKKGLYFSTIESHGFDFQMYEKNMIALDYSDTLQRLLHSIVFIKLGLSKELRKSFFAVLPPQFRTQRNERSIMSVLKPGLDLYFGQFIIELISMLYILFAYSSFAEINTSSLNSSRLSGEMVFWLFIQMIFMVGDRIAYLNRSLIMKWLLQITNIIVFGVQMIIVWPRATGKPFNTNALLIIFSLMKITYWCLSGVQIQRGYPTFDRSHSRMAKQYSDLYSYFFMIYSSVPFVFELRTILEWLVYPTVLRFDELLKVEEIFGTLFLIKTSILSQISYRKRGDLQPMFPVKFLQGGCVFIAILLILILPLLLFSTASFVSEHNDVESAQITIKLMSVPGFGTLDLLTLSNYQIYGSGSNQAVFPPELRKEFSSSSQSFQNVSFQFDADSIWTVPYPIRQKVSDLLLQINDDSQLSDTKVLLSYSFTRDGPTDNNPTESSQILSGSSNYAGGLTVNSAHSLANVIVNGNGSSWMCDRPLSVWLMLPASQSMRIAHNSATFPLSLTLSGQSQSTGNNNESNNELGAYWSVSMLSDDDSSSSQPLSFFLLNDDYVPDSVLVLTGAQSYSVIGLYVVVVYSFSQLLRVLYSQKMQKIQFNDLPSVDYLLRLVSAVKLARAQRAFFLEEQLYRKLIRIYRDPSILIKLTRRLDESKARALALDGFQDTASLNPNRFGFEVRRRRKQSRTEDETSEEASGSTPQPGTPARFT